MTTASTITPYSNYSLLDYLRQIQSTQGPQGIQGVAGRNGKRGKRGLRGPSGGDPGRDGSTILYGAAAPLSTEGNINDSYINTTTNEFFGPKGSDGWPAPISIVGPQGSPGPQGPNGTLVRYGASDPISSTGNDGDFYINTTSSILFGPKGVPTPEQWPVGISLVGAPGQSLLNGSGPPSSSTGNDNDLYIDYTNSTFYGPKTSGNWGSGSSMIGPAGQDGTKIWSDTQDLDNSIGVDGDFFMNTASRTFFGPKENGMWPPGFSMEGSQGPQGIQGPAGTDGQDGKTVMNGTASSLDNSIGTDGDFFYATDTYVLYGPKDSGVWPSSGLSLIGPTGSSVRSGTVDPTNSDFFTGDFYLNTTTMTIFGPKASSGVNQWGTGVSLKGPQGDPGPTGNMLRSGTIDPAPGTGNNGDFYINTSTYIIYGPKGSPTLGQWSSIGISLVGPQGPAGQDGAAGPGLVPVC